MNTSQRLGPYELQQCLEHTQQGEVWKAFDTQQRYYVSLYILHIGPQIAPGTVNLFSEKMRQLAALHHPNIVQILDMRLVQMSTNANERGILIVTEYVEYQPLTGYIQAITRAGQLPSPEEIVRLLAPLCDALDYAHQHGIVHGSIRPDSILLSAIPTTPDSPGMPRLIHFCTQYVQPPLTLPLNASFYVAPEQAQGDLDNPRSDIYALGVLLYELCTGTRPFYGDNPADVLMQHVHMTPPSPALIQPHLLPALTGVIVRCLSKDPAARFPTAFAVVMALAKALNIPVNDLASQSNIQVSTENYRHDMTMNNPTYLSPRLAQVQPSAAISMASNQLMPTPQSQNMSPVPAITPLTRNTPEESTIVRAQTPSAAVSPPIPAPPVTRQKRPRRYVILAALLILALLISTVGAYLVIRSKNNVQATSPVVGHAFFTNSGQYTPNGTQGIADVLQIYMNGIPDPHPNKSYYFWLLADNDGTDNLPILLGTSTNGGNIAIPFGDRNNRDLLANYSRFLVTEEDSGMTPNNPSFDTGTWRYYAEFSHTVNPSTKLSLLDHLRHLLAKDPKLQAAGLNGGLDIWLYRNVLNLMVLSSSVRDAQQTGSDPAFLRRQLVRILDYLDGSQYIQTEKLPPGLDPVQIDPTIARVALLEFDVNNQSPPGYLKHIGGHLSEIVDAPGVTPEQKALAIQIDHGLNNVQGWLNNVHKDAQELMQMSDSQLQQHSTQALFNDLYIQANHAFTGQFDPNTNQVKDGVSQIHAENLRLATFDIQPYQSAQ